MSRPFYSEYVKHALRFYTRNCIAQPRFKSDVDKNNWLACESVIKNYSEKDREILISIYSGFDTLPDEVYNASTKHSVEQNYIWDMMKEFERKIAKKRGLI